MSTLVFFHAHPDDEAIATGGTMAQAVDQGHRVVLVTATNGELGLPVEGVAEQGGELGALRRAELLAAAEILGIHRVETLGFHDSGMAGDDTNLSPHAFCQMEVDAAAQVLANILREESADVLTTYDANGGYGHPDHIQVHKVGIRAAELAQIDRVFESTINRDHFEQMMAAVLADAPADLEVPEIDPDVFGQPDAVITHAIPLAEYVPRKREAIMAHGSQVLPDSWFLSMDEATFAAAFGQEWYIQRGASLPDGAAKATSLFDLI
jgi:LmbE family N-acetylglucosaminyl deacetylase